MTQGNGDPCVVKPYIHPSGRITYGCYRPSGECVTSQHDTAALAYEWGCRNGFKVGCDSDLFAPDLGGEA